MTDHGISADTCEQVINKESSRLNRHRSAEVQQVCQFLTTGFPLELPARAYNAPHLAG